MQSSSSIRGVVALLLVAVLGGAFWFAYQGPESGTTDTGPGETSSDTTEESGYIEPLKLAADAQVDYNFHVKPILSNNCFACHGFDPNTRESGLRLDTREGATTNYAPEGEAPRFAVVPGSPEESELWKRINHHNRDLLMPPIESTKEALDENEKSIIKRWIAQGAEYKTHWSFIPPEKSGLPAVDNKQWVKNELDHYILEKIESMGTGPSAMADKATLIRRVTLDLTGLPPTPEEVDAFLEDDSPFAYEKVVDRLLKSPHYGERMALDWLDVSRYGDTNAHHVDLIRTSWPWRDWVIRAFNENKPYDEFIVEQLAGDLLEDPTMDQVLATSFNRNHPITNEGGAIDEEYLVEYAADRVHTVSTAFLGMTMACARCHDHKFDPVSIDEYYSFLSFFNSIDEVGLEAQDAKKAEGYRPYMYIAPNEDDQQALNATKQSLVQIKDAISGVAWHEEFNRLVESYELDWKHLTPAYRHAFWNGEKVSGPNYKYLKINSTLEELEERRKEAGRLEFDISLKDAPEGADLVMVHFYGLEFDKIGNSRDLDTAEGKAIVSEFDLHMVKGPEESPEIVKTLGVAEHWSSDSALGMARPAANAFDDDPATAWVQSPSDRALVFMLRLDEALPSTEEQGHLRLAFQLEKDSLLPIQTSMVHVYVAKGQQTLKHMAEQVRPFSLTATAPQRVRNRHKEQFALEWSVSKGAHASEMLAEWGATTDRHYLLQQNAIRVAVMQEKDEPTPTFVLDRGAYDSPLKDRPVDRVVPEALGEMDPDYPKNRLGLAYWLIDEDNPLTARVTVNRYWQLIFGNGLVRTAEDFGFQGELPTHPELLDYLAVDFMESGWDVKALMRKIVLSATYRQQSVRRPEFDLADPENRYLSWFPRRRLPAEFIRDNALAASGLLVPKVGGPSVKPYQPDGLWLEKTMRPNSNTGKFVRDDGEDLYRRGMYTFWKQVAPPPQMEAFDAPSREVCVIKRNNTNTPMQALVLLNDVTFLEASRAMASRVMDELPGEWETTLNDRLVRSYRYLTGRRPSEQSMEVLKNLTLESYKAFAADSEKAEGFLSYGESPIDEDADTVELATLAYTASAIMNLDKTITRD
ncbi:hypothetical protein DDZ13_08265 [Coraliomargarita sinensis]|uniref:Cytochrome c domain-containing protein n=1 Tax=Coraliomargarita sinensis TaxID=2174842 RepID=A0A317ZJS5_9BACT|nr:PSD1 and planctomycete cytochrome C domain-containing protein [Coraliomargarita sinensis]PXA04029.1 hypothetical protein DDZ13_08265 [Coraliomargarita sinensis]